MCALNKAMTIAGLDVSGGAGIAADLKTFQALNIYGMAALTVIVSQNPHNSWDHEIFPIDISVIKKEIDTIILGIGIDAMKTGMLGSAELVQVVADTIDTYKIKNVVIDPVMVCKPMDTIMVPEAAAAIKELLVSRCSVITPNIIEAAYLADMEKVTTLEEIKEAAARIQDLGAEYVVIKGGARMAEDEAIDVLYDGKKHTLMSTKKISQSYNHGAGCTYSAALTAGIANGLSVMDAAKMAKDFVSVALKESFYLNEYTGAVNHCAYNGKRQ